MRNHSVLSKICKKKKTVAVDLMGMHFKITYPYMYLNT